jgi:DNA-binding GntR family transcriptional regulator
VRRSSGEQAARYIRRLIFDGVLRPGARVPQDEIARALGVSRIPVREALIALEREGWVTIALHRGAFINALDERAVRDHYELFGLVYGFAARRAVERGDAELGVRLRELERKIAATDDPTELGRLVVAFHGTVVEAARSPRIHVVLRSMSALVPGDFFVLVPGAIAIERRGIAAVRRAVAARDGDRAAREYERMMRLVGDRVVRVFAERGLFGDAGTGSGERSRRRSGAPGTTRG